MTYNIIEDIVRWNIDRDNLQFDGGLAFQMLTEEVNEFAYASHTAIEEKFGDIFKNDKEWWEEHEQGVIDFLEGEEGQIAFKAHQLDALGDTIFVAVGEMGKILEGDWNAVEDVLLAITSANNLKSKEKNKDGKITKPADFVGPEEMIKKIVKGVCFDS